MDLTSPGLSGLLYVRSKSGRHIKARGYGLVVMMRAFQAREGGSIPSDRIFKNGIALFLFPRPILKLSKTKLFYILLCTTSPRTSNPPKL